MSPFEPAPAWAMLRLIQLLPWSLDNLDSFTLATLIFGPFYKTVHWFQTSAAVPWAVADSHYIWRAPESWRTSTIGRAVQWRLAMVWYFIHNEGIVASCFPLAEAPRIGRHLLALSDMMLPLVNYIDKNVNPCTLTYLYEHHLAPEQCAATVIDSTWAEDIVRLFIPMIFVGPATELWVIPTTLFRTLNLDPDNSDDVRSLRIFYGLLRRTLFRKTGMRSFLSWLHTALAIQTPSWLSATLVYMMKSVLLGACPEISAGLAFKERRLVYDWTWTNFISYFHNSKQAARPTDKDADTRVAMVLLAQYLHVFMQTKGLYGRASRQFISGWEAFKKTNDQLLKCVIQYFPNSPEHATINIIYKDMPLLVLQYSDSIAALASRNKKSLKKAWSTLFHLPIDWGAVTYLCKGFVVLLRCDAYVNPGSLLYAMQRAFTVHRTLKSMEPFLNRLTPSCRDRLFNLCDWIMHRRILQPRRLNHALALQQHLRLLEVHPQLRFADARCVPYCRKCDTIRFKPNGVKLPKSYVTTQIRAALMSVSCMGCGSLEIEPIDLLGFQLRCLLNPKNKPGYQTLILCSSCHHVTVFTPDYFVGIGPVCAECYAETSTFLGIEPATPQRCINQCGLPARHYSRLNRFLVQDAPDAPLETVAICGTCMPSELRGCANSTVRYSRRELLDASLFRLKQNILYGYTCKLKALPKVVTYKRGRR